MRHRVDFLAVTAVVLAAVDTLWGGFVALGLDLSRMNEVTLAVTFVLPFPVILFDLWWGKRIAISMLGLFFLRWIATCFARPSPVLCSPWRGNVLLISALLFLQISKFRRTGNFTRPHFGTEIDSPIDRQ